MSEALNMLDEVLSLLSQNDMEADSIEVEGIKVSGLRSKDSRRPVDTAPLNQRERPTGRELLFRHTSHGAPRHVRANAE